MGSGRALVRVGDCSSTRLISLSAAVSNTFT